MPDASPRPSSDGQEHILASRSDRNYAQTSGKLVVQLAAKKTQSINSSCLASVLRSQQK
jgi:hypothetical protein